MFFAIDCIINCCPQTEFSRLARVVSWLDLQSQDYAGAKWAIARTQNKFTNSLIDKAFNKGKIVIITFSMRPTWHFVTPEDVAGCSLR